MNPLVKKEIRLLLPSWLAVLFLEVSLPWFLKNRDAAFICMPLAFFFGMIILAVDSFGREFSLGTIQSQLSQPVERRQIWRAKIEILFLASAMIFGAYFASCELRLQQMFAPGFSGFLFKSTLTENDFADEMNTSLVLFFVALTGGLWTTLLLRQIATAFWVAFLAPAGILMSFILLFNKLGASDTGAGMTIYILAAIYSAASFWFAHWLFHRAQDVAWTGGIINFSCWRYFESRVQSGISLRRRWPIAALLKKEFQLHSITLICAGALLALHIVAILLRIFYGNYHKDSLAYLFSNDFWILWLVMPLIIGCTAVAEERKLGVVEGQFCLPVSRRLQFAIKFIPAMIFSVLLGGVMPLLLETIVSHFAGANEILPSMTNNENGFVSGLHLSQIYIVALAVGLAWIGFFASTLSKNFLQALSIAIVTGIGCWLFVSFIAYVISANITFFGIVPWHSILPFLIAVPVIPATLLWLAWRNFNHFSESRRLWQRNILGIGGALVFIVVGSAAIYNRAWEIFEPADLPHGAAKFSFSNPPKFITGNWTSLLVRFPDGRIWFDSLGYPFWGDHQSSRERVFWAPLLPPLPKSVGPQQFIGGASSSNWISASAVREDWWNPSGTTPEKAVHNVGYLDTVGIQRNGTLWISEKSEPETWTGDKMIRFGNETNWQQIVRTSAGFLLLKNDGTLWRWATSPYYWNGWQTNWPSVRALQPRQIGADFKWKEISSVSWMGCTRRADGTVWLFNQYAQNEKSEFTHEINWDGVNLQKFSEGDGPSAYVGTNGTLWIFTAYQNGNSWDNHGFLKVGQDTNWLAVSMNWNSMTALKSDGTLWIWNFPENSPRDVAKIQPTWLGIHDDWLGLVQIWGGSVALAADGSLWCWPEPENDGGLLKAPKQPELLGNVFGNSN